VKDVGATTLDEGLMVVAPGLPAEDEVAPLLHDASMQAARVSAVPARSPVGFRSCMIASGSSFS
jgi:hypothetical protein